MQERPHTKDAPRIGSFEASKNGVHQLRESSLEHGADGTSCTIYRERATNFGFGKAEMLRTRVSSNLASSDYLCDSSLDSSDHSWSITLALATNVSQMLKARILPKLAGFEEFDKN